MKQIYFDDYSDLACDIADKFDMVKDDFGDIAIIAKYEETKEIIAELVCIGYSLESIEFDRPDWKNYYDEYLISLNFDGIWCQPMKVDGKYITDDSTITYILDNCSSTVIPHCKGKVVFEVGIVDEDEYEDECTCDECQCTCKEESKPSVTSSKESYTINGKPVSKDEFLKVEEEFNKEFRDSLLSWCEIMDEMNEWRKLFSW